MYISHPLSHLIIAMLHYTFTFSLGVGVIDAHDISV